MSINNNLNKIKGNYDIDRNTILCLLILILVAISAFGLGKLSNKEDINKNSEISISYSNLTANASNLNNDFSKNTDTEREKVYVASKNGKLYYSLNCSGAKRILDKNKIYFDSSQNAEIAGFRLSESCK